MIREKGSDSTCDHAVDCTQEAGHVGNHDCGCLSDTQLGVDTTAKREQAAAVSMRELGS